MISNEKICFIYHRIEKCHFYFGFVDILSAFLGFKIIFFLCYILNNVFRKFDKMYFFLISDRKKLIFFFFKCIKWLLVTLVD